jgi:hypothetical protein
MYLVYPVVYTDTRVHVVFEGSYNIQSSVQDVCSFAIAPRVGSAKYIIVHELVSWYQAHS